MCTTGVIKIHPIASSAGGCSDSHGGDCSDSHAAAGSEPASACSPEIWDKIKDHPCYSEQAHRHYARMHVAVAPACNIQCNYCNRKYDCSNESRPGVVSEKLTPEQAARKVLAVSAAIPQMSVVGIAGPGDALANPAKTFKTFELIHAAAPDLKLCLSTNGLALPDHVDAIAALGVDHVTITINMIDPEVGRHIYPWIFFRNKRYHGVEAASILSERQLLGLEMLAARGILCKVNSVMIPGVNDRHLVEVNRAVQARGAFLHNIMPLISEAEHGTAYGLSGQRGPTPAELKTLQDRCEGGIALMRHCRQCRADAVGMLGQDRGAEFALAALAETEPRPDAGTRRAIQGAIEKQRSLEAAASLEAMHELRRTGGDITLQIAIATKGGAKIDQHFGHAEEFQIYEASRNGAKFIGHRRVAHYCQGGYDDEEALPGILRALSDCHAVLVAKIGGCPRKELRAAGIEASEEYAHQFIEASVIAYLAAYSREVESGARDHTPRVRACAV